jgi:hypothetical protein
MQYTPGMVIADTDMQYTYMYVLTLFHWHGANVALDQQQL